MNTEQERALLPCPFCGSAYIEVHTSTLGIEATPTHLMCAECGAAGPWSYERGGSCTVAAAFWNTRAALQSQDREDALIEVILEACSEWSQYVEVDSAPRTLREHVQLAIDHARRIEGDE